MLTNDKYHDDKITFPVIQQSTIFILKEKLKFSSFRETTIAFTRVVGAIVW